jgi:hypothetical protein
MYRNFLVKVYQKGNKTNCTNICHHKILSLEKQRNNFFYSNGQGIFNKFICWTTLDHISFLIRNAIYKQ